MKKFAIKEPVAVLGYGATGKNVINFLLSQGIKDISVYDKKNKLDFSAPKNIKLFLGKDYLKNTNNFNTIFRSPGIKYFGSKVTSATNFFFKHCPCRITAVTGSNGKTTVSSLIAKILKSKFKDKVIEAGNDKSPALEILPFLTKRHHVVMELSSFQLYDMKYSPNTAVLLNISENHLDWHKNFEDYAKSKFNILKSQNKSDFAIINCNLSWIMKCPASSVFWFGKKKGNHWAEWQKNELIIDKKAFINLKEIKCRTHPDNISAAVLAGIIHKIPKKNIKRALKNFPGIPGRLQFIRKIRKISFFNDTSCTTPESSITAINNFSPKKLILLLGGSSKGLKYTNLAKEITNKSIRTICYGEEGKKIRYYIKKSGGEKLILIKKISFDFQEIIETAFKKAKKEDSIVLSPACASFDMFKNSKERGREFNKIVKKLE